MNVYHRHVFLQNVGLILKLHNSKLKKKKTHYVSCSFRYHKILREKVFYRAAEY